MEEIFVPDVHTADMPTLESLKLWEKQILSSNILSKIKIILF